MKRKAVWIICILTALFCGCAANARVIITLDQVGPNVVAKGSGTLDITDLPVVLTVNRAATISSSSASLEVGPTTAVLANFYFAALSGPRTFGSRTEVGASTGTGDYFGISGSSSQIRVSANYVSGTPLSGTATWNNRSLTSPSPGLDAIPGIYTWTWGTGANADSLRLIVTPEPGTLGLLSLGAAGLALLKWRFWA